MSTASFTTTYDESTSVLSVAGDVDESSSAALREAIAVASGNYSRSTVVDLSGVQYLPSSAIAVLVTILEQASGDGADVELQAATGTIAKRVLEVCALPHRTA